MKREDRAKRMLAFAAGDAEQEEAERLIQAASYRRAVFLAYCAAGFSESESIEFIKAELGAAVVYLGDEDGVAA